MIEALILQRLKEEQGIHPSFMAPVNNGSTGVLPGNNGFVGKNEDAAEGDTLAVTGTIGERRGTGMANARGLGEDLETRLQIA